jgi:Domain of unknown function (DUF2383).
MDGNQSTLNGTTAEQTEILEGLNDLLQLDHDAIGAYEVAIEKLEDRSHASQIRGFKRDHERHIESLNQTILSMGGVPKNEPHGTGPLKEAIQGLSAVAGDRGLLMAWRTNEHQVRTKYDRYASKANAWPSDVKRLIDENALDEERHYHWVTEVLEPMGGDRGSALEARVREEPLKVVLASLAVGFVIGRILR